MVEMLLQAGAVFEIYRFNRARMNILKSYTRNIFFTINVAVK